MNENTSAADDEIDFVLCVRRLFVQWHGQSEHYVESGDLLFVAAGCEHHYEDFTEDLALWRVFYGPSGGEVS